MSQLESEQVTLRLSSDKEILDALRVRKAMDKDEKGPKFCLQFDANTFEFRPGRTITVNQSVAKALIRSSYLITGDDLTGDMRPALEVVDSFQIGRQDAGPRTNTTCPVCNEDQHTLALLAKHIAKEHAAEAVEKGK